jgi:hypothetical protein
MIFGLFNSFLFGVILISLLDFILFLFLKINYFNALNINEYFNDIFVANHNFVILLSLTIPVGYLFIYAPFRKWIEKLYLFCILIAILGFVPSIGLEIGKKIFLEPNKTFILGNTTFNGDLLYRGKKFVYIKRPEIEKTIAIEEELLQIN